MVVVAVGIGLVYLAVSGVRKGVKQVGRLHSKHRAQMQTEADNSRGRTKSQIEWTARHRRLAMFLTRLARQWREQQAIEEDLYGPPNLRSSLDPNIHIIRCKEIR